MNVTWIMFIKNNSISKNYLVIFHETIQKASCSFIKKILVKKNHVYKEQEHF